jgi:hypothetical protein
VRIPASEDATGAVERLLSRRQLRIEIDHVVIRRQEATRPNFAGSPRWQYRVADDRQTFRPGVFTSFQHAASDAEQLALERQARLFYVEDTLPALLSDYRRG